MEVVVKVRKADNQYWVVLTACVNADSKVPKCAEVKFPSCRG